MQSQDVGLKVVRAGGIGTVTLSRPEKHNAFDDKLITSLTATFQTLGADPELQAIVLRAEGQSFSAGADVNWMRRMVDYSESENLIDARALATLMEAIDSCPKPTVALVQGPAIGGGVGLVACCDIAIAADSAFLQLSEVRLGLTPATISPYVVRAMGGRAARRYFLTAERITAAKALQHGLFHEVVPEAELEAVLEKTLTALRQGGMVAQQSAKALVALVRERDPASVREETARQIASIRVGNEAQEGLTAFLEKRQPTWRQDNG